MDTSRARNIAEVIKTGEAARVAGRAEARAKAVELASRREKKPNNPIGAESPAEAVLAGRAAADFLTELNKANQDAGSEGMFTKDEIDIMLEKAKPKNLGASAKKTGTG
mgnify:CR=1 FL=1